MDFLNIIITAAENIIEIIKISCSTEPVIDQLTGKSKYVILLIVGLILNPVMVNKKIE